MFCPECGEVIAPGPINPRRCPHGAGCANGQSVKGRMRFKRILKKLLNKLKLTDEHSGVASQPTKAGKDHENLG